MFHLPFHPFICCFLGVRRVVGWNTVEFGASGGASLPHSTLVLRATLVTRESVRSSPRHGGALSIPIRAEQDHTHDDGGRGDEAEYHESGRKGHETERHTPDADEARANEHSEDAVLAPVAATPAITG